ncbi:MAG: hypothetical protein MUF87_10150 [Anaerolineae bacterium]|jgi:hypothetical protein|nr:hypothetical protein [Anaerolineae bacterium]
MKLQLDLKTILNNRDNLQVLNALENFAQQSPDEFRQAALLWAPAVYQRDRELFNDLILTHLSQNAPTAAIEALLPLVETNHDLFLALYKQIVTPDRWKREFDGFLKSRDIQKIAIKLALRYGDWAQPTEDQLIQLYLIDPAYFELYFQGILSKHYSYFMPPPPPLDRFITTVEQHHPNTNFKERAFRAFVSSAEWEKRVNALLQDHHPANIAVALNRLHPDDLTCELPDSLLTALIEQFGQYLLPYLKQKTHAFIRAMFDTLFSLSCSDEMLVTEIWTIARECGYERMIHLRESWALRGYQRNPGLFKEFFIQYLQPDALAQDLLDRAEQDGEDEVFAAIYARHLCNSSDWNLRLGMAIDSAPDASTLARILNRLDVQATRIYLKHYPIITDQNAAALYRHNPTLFYPFIEQYLDERHDYPLLIAAWKESPVIEWFNRIFRKTATAADWHAEMEHLLTQDLPADQILAALEARLPSRSAQINPAILKRFIDRYGEAVLPFFERYIDWTHPTRLQRLLDLPLDRAVLLRELQAIARRQPTEFSERAEIWAERLYAISPEFFGAFIAQNLNLWQSKPVLMKLLERAEADGHENLFQALYRRTNTWQTWLPDLQRLIDSPLNNADLHARLMRRANAWHAITDDLAVKLYQRDPVLFEPFILMHMGQERYNHQKGYSKLLKLARKRGDHSLLEAIEFRLNPMRRWEKLIQTLLAEKPSGSDVNARLMATLDQQQNQWSFTLPVSFFQLLAHYQDELMPFLSPHLDLLLRIKNVDAYPELRLHLSLANYDRLLILWRNKAAWNHEIKQLAESNAPIEAVQTRLISLASHAPDHSWWGIEPPIAHLFYERYLTLASAFLERFLRDLPQLRTLQLALERGDQTLMDVLVYRTLLGLNRVIHLAYPPTSRWYKQKADLSAQKQLAGYEQLIIDWFDQLYQDSPEHYVQHAAAILGYLAPFEWSEWWINVEKHAIWQHLHTRHLEAWTRSPYGIACLLESLNIHPQLLALTILTQGGVDAAQRVKENLRALKVMLLSSTRKTTKRQVLSVLKQAALADASLTESILPLLKEAAEFYGRRAIPDEIAQLYVQLEVNYA